MNAAIASRVTSSLGQYTVADVQPSVMLRFFTHSTFGQKAGRSVDRRTSVKPAQFCARAAGLAAAAASAKAPA